MSHYRNPAMKQLTDQQVRYAPRDARLKQIEKAESLLANIDPRKEYPYRDICESITDPAADRGPPRFGESGRPPPGDLRTSARTAGRSPVDDAISRRSPPASTG